MEDLIAYCGNNCAECDTYKATINNDRALKEKIAVEWAQLHEKSYTADMITCGSCKGDGVLFGYCSACRMRSCAISRGVESCLSCADTKTCKAINDFIAWLPEVKSHDRKKFDKLLKSRL